MPREIEAKVLFKKNENDINIFKYLSVFSLRKIGIFDIIKRYSVEN